MIWVILQSLTLIHSDSPGSFASVIILPPSSRDFSASATLWPISPRTLLASKPAGPEPTTSTLFLFLVVSIFSGETKEIFCDFVIPITRKIPITDLYDDLCSKRQEFRDNGIQKIIKIGDAEAPSIIAAAVHSGTDLLSK